jgi:hypothetical protein
MIRESDNLRVNQHLARRVLMAGINATAPSTGNFATEMQAIEKEQMQVAVIQAQAQVTGQLANGLTAAAGEIDHQ